jgi:tRNA modification GTPase
MTTIFALASAQGRAGVAVLRVSGEKAGLVFSRLCKPAHFPEPRVATLRALIDERSEDLLDRALVIWFPAPHSFTGENVVEIQLHGGRAVIASVCDALASLPDFEPAGPGAFSRRAFENGKLDLTEAEAIADLVEAETSAQQRQALRQMDGALGRLYHDWAERLKHALAFMEASIDFADEDVPAEISENQRGAIKAVAAELAAHLDDDHRGERLREGFMVALLGPPNAGKSSLMNALARRDAAIVSSTPGTTRDVIEVHLDLGGWPLCLADTAGLRECAEEIESEGVRRALARAETADLKILVFDGASDLSKDEKLRALIDDRTIAVLNKADLLKDNEPPPYWAPDSLRVSAKTGQGIEALVQAIIDRIDLRYGAGGEISGAPSLTRARHRLALEECRSHLARAATVTDDVLCTEDVRLAVRALGRITGRVDVEDLLDLIFSEFCIGK